MSASDTWSASFTTSTVEAMTAYDAVVPFMFAPWAEALLDEVGVALGETVLDVATGPGTVARLVATRLGTSGLVTACDLSPAMLAVATAKADLDGAAPITYLNCPPTRWTFLTRRSTSCCASRVCSSSPTGMRRSPRCAAP